MSFYVGSLVLFAEFTTCTARHPIVHQQAHTQMLTILSNGRSRGIQRDVLIHSVSV